MSQKLKYKYYLLIILFVKKYLYRLYVSIQVKPSQLESQPNIYYLVVLLVVQAVLVEILQKLGNFGLQVFQLEVFMEILNIANPISYLLVIMVLKDHMELVQNMLKLQNVSQIVLVEINNPFQLR